MKASIKVAEIRLKGHILTNVCFMVDVFAFRAEVSAIEC